METVALAVEALFANLTGKQNGRSFLISVASSTRKTHSEMPMPLPVGIFLQTMQTIAQRNDLLQLGWGRHGERTALKEIWINWGHLAAYLSFQKSLLDV